MKQNLISIQQRIERSANKCGRDPKTIRLVAVGKTQTADRVREAVCAGATIIGENYIQEAREKFDQLVDLDVQWHFIGHLQSNKAKYAVRMFSLIHSVDSIKLAKELNKQAKKIGKRQRILVQVNIGDAPSKSGLAEKEAAENIVRIAEMENLHILGLMTMPPFFDDPERARPYFAALRRLRDSLSPSAGLSPDFKELSMGMTGDFEAAIEEGATLVRIGTALFGARQ
ncbi:MAG: YggS family pyridoxal phosphate-dependent enzyme [Desulfobacteraceae bacterium]|jgi:pyridoxal phosphate enzyme (YggS family)